MEIVPLQDYVVIQEAQDVIERSTILVPEIADTEPKNQGRVVKLADNAFNRPAFAEGSIVIFRRHMFDDLDKLLNDERYKGLVLGKVEHVIAMIKEKSQ